MKKYGRQNTAKTIFTQSSLLSEATAGADEGMDGGGTYRHIAREKAIANIFLQKTEIQSYDWVCHALHRRAMKEELKIDILDTVILEHLVPASYLYTAANGLVRKKSKGDMQWERIRESFLTIATMSQSVVRRRRLKEKTGYVAVLQKIDGFQLLNEKEFDEVCKVGPGVGSLTCQSYVRPRGIKDYAKVYANFHHELIIHEVTGKPQHKFWRSGVDDGVMPSRRRQPGQPPGAVASNVLEANRAMEKGDMQIKGCCERCYGCSVLKLCSDWLQDEEGRVWLVRVTQVEIAAPKTQKRPESPEVSRQLRQDNIARGSVTTKLGLLESQDPTVTGGSLAAFQAPPGYIPTRAERRALRRMEREKPPDDAKVAEILNAPKTKKKVRLPARVRPSTVGGYGNTTQRRKKQRFAGDPLQRPATSPTKTRAQLDAIRPGTGFARNEAVSRALGSSQLEGCKGDFCNMHLSIKQDWVRQKQEPNFRKRLEMAERREASGESDVDFVGMYNAIGRQASGNSLLGEDDKMYTVSQRVIVQSRKERKLVDLFIQRYRKHEPGDYVEDLAYLAQETVTVGGSFPGTYYADATVCANCFKIYNLVDKARTKAVRKLEGKAASKKLGDQRPTTGRPGSPGVGGSTLTPIPRPSTANIAMEIEAFYGDMSPSDYSEETKALMIATAAIERLTKQDLAEVRALDRPHPAVVMVVKALTIMLEGRPLPWSQAKKLMSKTDFLNRIRRYHPDMLKPGQIDQLENYLANPAFHPTHVQPISKAGAKLCGWILGIITAQRWRAGTGHLRTDPLKAQALRTGRVKNERSMTFAEKLQRKKDQEVRKTWEKQEKKKQALRQKHEQQKRMQGQKGQTVSFGVTSDQQSNNQILGSQRLPSEMQHQNGVRPMTTPVKGAGAASRQLQRSQTAGSIVESPSGPEGLTGSLETANSRPSIPDLAETGATASFWGTGQLNQSRAATSKSSKSALRSMAQQRQMQRLAAKDDTPGIQRTTDNAQVFRCQDDSATFVWEVLGRITGEDKLPNFIFIHDLFDTLEQTKIFFKPMTLKFPDLQILIFNYPGQAGTRFPKPSSSQDGEEEEAHSRMNNVWMAEKVHELLQHVENQGAMFFSLPFHAIGIGYGASIASAFATRYRDHLHYADAFRSLACINGFTCADTQLAAILHSSMNAFSNFPANRPDLPVSYFTKFLFSQEYLGRVNHKLALNIYTAVGNPITLEGRLQVCRGALLSQDLSRQIAKLKLPVILIQSTENVLVNAANVDPFLENRKAHHIWSHQLQLNNREDDSCLGELGVTNLVHTLKRTNGAFVVWAQAGHEIRQECKRVLLDLFDVLVVPKYEPDLYQQPLIQVPKQFVPPPGAGAPPEQSVDELERITQSIIAARATEVKKSAPVEEEDEWSESGEEEDFVPLRPGTASELLPPSMDEEEDEEGELAEAESEFEKILAKHKKTKRTKRGTQEVSGISLADHAFGTQSTMPMEMEADLLADFPVEPSEGKWSAQDFMTADEIIAKALRGGGPVAIEEGAPQRQVQSQPMASAVNPRAQSPKFTRGGVAREVADLDTLLERAKRGFDAVAEFSMEQVLEELGPEKPEDDGDGVLESKESEPSAFPSKVDPQATAEDRYKGKWTDEVKDISSSLERDAEILRKQAEIQYAGRDRKEALLFDQTSETKQEDEKLMDKLVKEMEDHQRGTNQRNVDINKTEKNLVHQGLVPEHEMALRDQALRTLPPTNYEADSIPGEFKVVKAGEVLDNLEEQAGLAAKEGMKLEDYLKVREQIAIAKAEEDLTMKHQSMQEQRVLMNEMANRIQRVYRGKKGRDLGKRQKWLVAHMAELTVMGIRIQKIARGFIARSRVNKMREIEVLEMVLGGAVLTVQRHFRGFIGRKIAYARRRELAALMVQRVYRGHVGRRIAQDQKERLERIRLMGQSATLIQCSWRMHKARKKYTQNKVHNVAASEIQRVYRGHLGRLKVARRRKWEQTPAGHERVKLGLGMIEDAKVKFELQKNEIDALHKAQEKAEGRVSYIHAQLSDAENEISVLEREMNEMDQIERDINAMTHERELLQAGIMDAAGVGGKPLTYEEDIQRRMKGQPRHEIKVALDAQQMRNKGKAHALEMQIRLKRSEREKKKAELETEFAGVYQEIAVKKSSLKRLETAIADMEGTRLRKEREFAHLQRNLMELLSEQKFELDAIKARGLELEVRSATAASAAQATALRSKMHQEKSGALMEQTEEMMKFQFMSMSMNYFSNLHMLKNVRDLNADQTAAAVSGAALAANAATAAAQAAGVGGTQPDGITGQLESMGMDAHRQYKTLQEKRDMLKFEKELELAVKAAAAEPFPSDTKLWNVQDVGRWLDTLNLTQYKQSFKEARIDGDFLMEIRKEDMEQVLGIDHPLHIQKILYARNKLRPLSQDEEEKKAAVEYERKTDMARVIPDKDTVFSQARNGRLKRLEESLRLGFPINDEDDQGNTLLLIAVQNLNRKMVEMLLARGASLNHKNLQGNTALHYAMSYDPSGTLGEYLIEKGADDSIENNNGLSPYDGI